jgi:hypothetical protein
MTLPTQPITCGKCGFLNVPTAPYCLRCEHGRPGRNPLRYMACGCSAIIGGTLLFWGLLGVAYGAGPFGLLVAALAIAGGVWICRRAWR